MRIILFIALTYLALHLTPVMLIPLAVLYVFFWPGLELVVLAFLIDAYFGIVAAVPMYTLSAVGLVVLVEWIRPRVTFYTI